MGGLGIYAGFVAALLVYFGFSREIMGLLVSSSLVFAVGIVDDIKGVSPGVKLLGQVAAAVIFIACGGYIKYLTNPIGGDIIFLDYWGIPVTLLWLVGISNAVNLIDGLDGLAGGVSAIAAITMAIVAFSTGYNTAAVLAIFLVFALIGFLRYNFSPAQIFMGDSGSLFLGFTLAALAIMGFAKGATMISLVIPVLILGIPIFDTFFAIARRYQEGKPIFQADKGHLHHRLLAIGLSHKQTVVIIYAITMFMGVAAILLTLISSAQAVLILFIILLISLIGARRLGVLHGAGNKKNQKAEGK
jgi:UDP-GlcNAc:undecaprenyl-phosphate GlcNAc-1-phosphate transferase